MYEHERLTWHGEQVNDLDLESFHGRSALLVVAAEAEHELPASHGVWESGDAGVHQHPPGDPVGKVGHEAQVRPSCLYRDLCL